uniref:Uncharacterized protein n=1 Tax=Timema genevievae TaxID=629358 RepID=A0A7R9PIG5_TIMGE|nr:unnamed protein product [Timema genevievae]
MTGRWRFKSRSGVPREIFHSPITQMRIAQSADINQTVFYDESILFYPETILVKQTQAVNITFFVLFLILVAVAVVANLFTIYVSYTRLFALSSTSLKPILWDGGWEGERRGVASQPTKVSFRANKNRWITETVDGASYRTGRVRNHSRKDSVHPTRIQTPNFAIIGIPVYCETDASDQVTTEAGIVESIRTEITGTKP